jgi:phosphopantetheinyl transferase
VIAQVEVFGMHEIAPDPALLSVLEREALTALRGERRRDQWIRGRIALRRVHGDPAASVVTGADGAPVVVGGAYSVSLSHDDDWIAVAMTGSGSRVGVDLCARSKADRVRSVVSSLNLRGDELDPVACWTCLEAVLKLRAWPIETLRDAALELVKRDDHVVVRGLGADAVVHTRNEPDYVIAWTTES